MIYFLSDPHGDINFSGLKKYIDIATDEDLLIVLGDIGLNFENTDANRRFDEYFLSADKNIAFVDGNHENFEYINSFPEEEWNGGTVHRLTPHIVHLKRGNIFTVNGKTFFVFGGCKSSPKWKEMGLWYFGEEPSDDEIALAHANLQKHNFSVDYILTHKYELNCNQDAVADKLNDLTQFIEDNVKYQKWYAGHWHVHDVHDDKHMYIYDVLTSLE